MYNIFLAKNIVFILHFGSTLCLHFYVFLLYYSITFYIRCYIYIENKFIEYFLQNTNYFHPVFRKKKPFLAFALVSFEFKCFMQNYNCC